MFFATLEDIVTKFLYCLCLGLAVVLVVLLIRELLSIFWPQSIPFIHIVATVVLSLAAVILVIYYLKVTGKSIQMCLGIISYHTFELPAHWILDPYKKATSRLQFVCVILLYVIVSYLAVQIVVYLSPSKESIIKRIFIAYGVFYVMAMCMAGILILCPVIRKKFIKKLKLKRR